MRLWIEYQFSMWKKVRRAENLGGVIGLDAEALSQVNLSDPFFQSLPIRPFPGRRSRYLRDARRAVWRKESRRGRKVFHGKVLLDSRSKPYAFR